MDHRRRPFRCGGNKCGDVARLGQQIPVSHRHVAAHGAQVGAGRIEDRAVVRPPQALEGVAVGRSSRAPAGRCGMRCRPNAGCRQASGCSSASSRIARRRTTARPAGSGGRAGSTRRRRGHRWSTLRKRTNACILWTSRRTCIAQSRSRRTSGSTGLASSGSSAASRHASGTGGPSVARRDDDTARARARSRRPRSGRRPATQERAPVLADDAQRGRVGAEETPGDVVRGSAPSNRRPAMPLAPVAGVMAAWRSGAPTSPAGTVATLRIVLVPQ